jgi:hypothetical protein
MPRKRLAPVHRAPRRPAITRNGLTAPQLWESQTTDGEWDFERSDEPGTPWLAYHRPSAADGSCVFPVAYCGTEEECRAMAADGRLAVALERTKAEAAARASRTVWHRKAG